MVEDIVNKYSIPPIGKEYFEKVLKARGVERSPEAANHNIEVAKKYEGTDLPDDITLSVDVIASFGFVFIQKRSVEVGVTFAQYVTLSISIIKAFHMGLMEPDPEFPGTWRPKE